MFEYWHCHAMAEIPAAFEWEKAMRIDPLNLQEYEKDLLDELISMFLLVIVHISHHHHHAIPAANLNFLCFCTVCKLSRKVFRCKVKQESVCLYLNQCIGIWLSIILLLFKTLSKNE